MVANRRYLTRKFINRQGHHSVAFVYALVEKTKPENSFGPETQLIIGDCSKTISLDFDMTTQDGASNSLYKIDLLIETLTEFRAALAEEDEVLKERNRLKGEKRKAKKTA